MKAEQFLEEVLTSSHCPEGFDAIYPEFQKYQKAALDTLNEVHRVCELNGINYQLAFGSLLGAIRDGGQIPWDYDIDVFVPYSEKMLLVEALKKDLDERFYFYCPEVDKRCRHLIMRVAPKEYCTEALHVDVFYYVGVPSDPQEREAVVDLIQKTARVKFAKRVKTREEAAGSFRNYLYLWKQKVKHSFTNLKKLQKEYDQVCQKYPISDVDYVVSADWFAGKYLFPKELFMNSELITIETGTFRISSDYKKMLTILYKDYEKVPALESRIKEVQDNYKRLRFFDKIQAKKAKK